MTDHDVAALLRRVQELEARQAELEARTSRRHFFAAAGAATLGAVGAVTAGGGADRAHAAANGNLILGVNNSSNVPTRVVYDGAALAADNGDGGLYATDEVSPTASSGATAAVRGVARRVMQAGVSGFTGRGAGTSGVFGQASGDGVGVNAVSSTGSGVLGTSSSGFGVDGRSTSSVGVFGGSFGGTGVKGNSTFGIGVQGESSQVAGVSGKGTDSAHGVEGVASNGSGLHGTSASGAGVRGASTFGSGVVGNGVVGGRFEGTRAALRLAHPSAAAPPSRVDFHEAGELDVDGANNLWLCVTGGSPGVWRKVGGVSTAGAFHAIGPFRVYDSRLVMVQMPPFQPPGPLSSGQNRTMTIVDARNTTTGAIVTPNVVPVGATAVTYNLTVTSTVGNGFLSVNPASASTFSAASINWTGAMTLGNAAVVGISNGAVKVFCGGSGASAQFIVDITGFYL